MIPDGVLAALELAAGERSPPCGAIRAKEVNE